MNEKHKKMLKNFATKAEWTVFFLIACNAIFLAYTQKYETAFWAVYALIMAYFARDWRKIAEENFQLAKNTFEAWSKHERCLNSYISAFQKLVIVNADKNGKH